jgi:hypothetical protein
VLVDIFEQNLRNVIGQGDINNPEEIEDSTSDNSTIVPKD